MKSQQLKIGQIRESLRSKLFQPRKSVYLNAEELKNQSPPSIVVQKKTIQPQNTFRHFDDVYYYKRLNKATIGEGAHAIVKRCYKRQECIMNEEEQPYATKIFRTDDPEIINTIRQTFQLNRQLNDISYVCRAYDLFINAVKGEVHLIMEYCKWPTLEHIMKNQKLHESTKLQILYQLALAVDAIHQRGVSHRDIKPDNILVNITEYGVELKLIDFGVSKRFTMKNKNKSRILDMWTRTGTILYQAPEIFYGGGYTEKIDIWSVGVIAYQLLCGGYPFICETNLDTIEMILDLDYNVENTNNFQTLTNLQQDLIKRLLKKSPEKRLSAVDFILHPLLLSQSCIKKKSNKSLDDSNINQYRILNDQMLSQSSMIEQKMFQRQINGNKQQIQNVDTIEEDDESQSPDKSRKNSWRNWGNHIHYGPDKQISSFTLNLQSPDRPSIGISQELQSDQHSSNSIQESNAINLFGPVRTGSIQLEQNE